MFRTDMTERYIILSDFRKHEVDQEVSETFFVVTKKVSETQLLFFKTNNVPEFN